MAEKQRQQRSADAAPRQRSRSRWHVVTDVPQFDAVVLWPLFVLIVGFAVITRAVFGTPSWTVIAIAVAVPSTVLVPATIVFLRHWHAQRGSGASDSPGQQAHTERG